MDSLSILDGGFYKWLKEVKDTESSDDVQTEEVNRMTRGNF
jgi:3-mercaptopyruvate sulfurtransferase SseA